MRGTTIPLSKDQNLSPNKFGQVFENALVTRRRTSLQHVLNIDQNGIITMQTNDVLSPNFTLSGKNHNNQTAIRRFSRY